MSDIEIRGIDGKSRRDVASFIDLPLTLYGHDPSFVAPLRMDVKKLFDRKKNSFFQHGDIQPFIALREGVVSGSIAAVHNEVYNEYHGEKTGFFMSFECVDDREVADGLFEAAEGWLVKRGMNRVIGPMSYSTESLSPGLLITGFADPPFFLMGHALSHYRRLVEGAGYEKAVDVLAFRMDIQQEPDPRLVRLVERIGRTRNISVRFVDPKNLERDGRIIFEIYKAAWADNWGFVPPSENDFRDIFGDLKRIYIRELAQIAEIDGKPVGWAITLPNLNEAFSRMKGRLFPFGIFTLLLMAKRLKGLRLWGLGILPEYRRKGVDVMLYYHTLMEGQRLGYQNGELSWILETNTPTINAAHLVRGEEYKRYRIYQKRL
jgi:GNAT superfamily N-acetyltransferase